MNFLSRRVREKIRQRKSSLRRRFTRFETLEARQLLAGDILGAVYNDINGNGVRDQGDNGLANWTVYLDSNNSGSLDAGEPAVLTDADGHYDFRGIDAGDYRVAEVVRSGWTPTNPTSGFVDVTLTDGQERTVNFLNKGSGGTGAITGNVWRDINNNNVQDPEDTGLAGWTLFIDLNGDKVLDPDEPFVETDGNGDYTFSGLLGGAGTSAVDYEITEVIPSGWEPKDENITAAVIDGQTTSGIDFSNWPDPEKTTSVSGRVFNDANGNGTQDGGEVGFGGWTVFADLNLNNLPDVGEPFGTTSSNGNYSLTGIEAGKVRIAEVKPIEYKSTSPAAGYQNVTLVAGSALSGVDFGNQLRTDAAIGGVIYVDRDKDGVRDPGEEGLPGITVYLDVDASGSLTPGDPSMVTGKDLFYTPDVDEAGTYRFDKLAGGTYIVRQIVPAELDSPGSEIEHTVTVGPADDVRDLELGDEYRPSEIHGVKFDDANGNRARDAGEAGIGGVTIFIDLDRDNVFDDGVEPSTLTLDDGSYSFVGLEADAYIVREIVPAGFVQTFPETADGILWPEGVNNAAVGNVTPTLIETSLTKGETYTQTVSLTLPTTGALTNLVDVFLLFDDTGSFTSNSPIVRAAFPNIIAQLQTKLPGIDLGFGVGRLEEYGNFASEYSTGRPFVLNQPIVAADVVGFSSSIQAALDRVAPGYGGDEPETVIEALYQMVSGAGFDGNNNGSSLDSGAAGLASTQVDPGNSGDVPAFSTFTPDPVNGVLPASGTIGGAGFRSGALPIIITATDTGFAYQPKGETSIVGIDGLTLPVSALTATSRGTTPFSSGAGIQQTVTGLNALGALVIGLGTNDGSTEAPREGLESLASLTGAINRTTNSIANGTLDPIDPGDPFYFKIGTGGDPLVGNIADGIVAAIDGAVTSVNVNVTLRASDPRVHINFTPGVINGLGAGDTATFGVTFTGDGRPHRFDLQFVREGTDVVLGSIPVVLGTPVSGDGYEYEDCEDGEQSQEVNFGNRRIDGIVPNVAPSFTIGPDQIVAEDDDTQTVVQWATNVSPGPVTESDQVVNFIVSNDNNDLFASQPAISADGTLSFTPAENAFGTTIVTVQIHDNGDTGLGGVNVSDSQTFAINISPVNDAPTATDDAYSTNQGTPLLIASTGVLLNDSDIDSATITAAEVSGPSNGSLTLAADGSFTYTPNPGFTGTDSFSYQASDGAALSTSAVVTIDVTPLPEEGTAEFSVVDASDRRTYLYDADGNSLGTKRLNKEDESPRGITTSPDGSTQWVVDKKGEVFVYDHQNRLLGSWEIQDIDKPEGITVYGDDLWVVDREKGRVYFFENGAIRRSGDANPTSSFRLDRSNRNPMDIVTDGTHVWVVDDARAIDKVFRYTLGGALEGSWAIDSANAQPTGLTIDLNDVNHLWIVDSRSDAVYQYDSAATRVDGQQLASREFALATANRNPQGIAYPPSFGADLISGGRWEPRMAKENDGHLHWENPKNELDVNDDGNVSAGDALAIINHLGRHESSDVAMLDVNALFLDCNSDGHITAADVLNVINGLGRIRMADQSKLIDQAISQLDDEEDSHDEKEDEDFEATLSHIVSLRSK